MDEELRYTEHVSIVPLTPHVAVFTLAESAPGKWTYHGPFEAIALRSVVKGLSSRGRMHERSNGESFVASSDSDVRLQLDAFNDGDLQYLVPRAGLVGDSHWIPASALAFSHDDATDWVKRKNGQR